MAKLNGTLLKMEVVGSPNKPIRNTRDISLNISVDLIDTSDRDDEGWTTRLRGRRDWGGKLTGVVDMATAANKETIATLITHEIGGDLINVVFTTARTGDTSFTGNVLISNIGMSFAAEGEALWTCDCQASGPLTVATIV